MSSITTTELTQWELQANNPSERAPLVLGDNDFTTVTDTVTALGAYGALHPCGTLRWPFRCRCCHC